MMDFAVHQTLSSQYKRAKMIKEAEQAKDDSWTYILKSAISLPFSCIAAISFLVTCVFWVYGIIAALLANRDCGSAPQVFWIVPAVLVVVSCCIMPCIAKCLVEALIDWVAKADKEDDPDTCEA